MSYPEPERIWLRRDRDEPIYIPPDREPFEKSIPSWERQEREGDVERRGWPGPPDHENGHGSDEGDSDSDN